MRKLRRPDIACSWYALLSMTIIVQSAGAALGGGGVRACAIGSCMIVTMDGASNLVSEPLRAAVTQLERVVAVHEGAKAILSDSHQVNLRALDATVRSLRRGSQLRGFAEVSAQMREWSQELHAAVEQVTKSSAEQVNVVSAFEKHKRTLHLLSAGGCEPASALLLAPALERVASQGREIELALQKLQRQVRRLLEDLQQLGLMACVLSTSALIEAATAGDDSQDLTTVSRDFSERSQKMTESIRRMLASDRQGSA